MNDDAFEKLLHEVAATYRSPPPAPLDALWPRIEREALDRPARPAGSAVVRWFLRAAPLAAAAALGIVVGRVTAPSAPAEAPAAESAPSPAALPDPLFVLTSEYLGETTALLAALPGQGAGPDQRFVSQARDLLSTTRLLLDSPGITDPDLTVLLEDLELVLVQIARLPAAGAAEEVDLITETLEFRDVLARLRSAAVATTLTRS